MLARALPFFIIVVCLVGLLGSIIIGRYNFTICGLIIAVPAITAGIVLLHIYHYDLEFLSWSGFQFPFEQRTLTLLFGVIFFPGDRSWPDLPCRIPVLPQWHRSALHGYPSADLL